MYTPTLVSLPLTCPAAQSEAAARRTCRPNKEYQRRKACALGWTEVHDATVTSLQWTPGCYLPSYARLQTVVEFPANPAEIEEFRARMKIVLPSPTLEAASAEVEGSPVIRDARIGSAVSSTEVDAASKRRACLVTWSLLLTCGFARLVFFIRRDIYGHTAPAETHRCTY